MHWKSIDKVARQTDPPTFENTIEALQDSGELLDRNSAILFNLNSAETSDVIQASYTTGISPADSIPK
jgi:peptidyl-dipeptidase Dcp